MSALGEAIAAWRALPAEERDKLVDFLTDDTRERRAQLRSTLQWRAEAESWIRVNEAALALLEAAARSPVAGAPLERIKEAAKRAARGRAA